MNNSLIRYAIVFLVVLVLQIYLVPFFEIVHWKPDLILIILVMFAIRHGRKLASTAGFLTGVISDFVSGGLLGLGALSRTITGYAAGWLALFFQEKGQFIFTLFVSGIIQDGIYFYINTLGRDVSWRVIIFVHIIPNLFYTAIVGAVVYYFLSRWLNEND